MINTWLMVSVQKMLPVVIFVTNSDTNTTTISQILEHFHTECFIYTHGNPMRYAV
jgi:hypothetical protein